jgi:hypothetical protein
VCGKETIAANCIHLSRSRYKHKKALNYTEKNLSRYIFYVYTCEINIRCFHIFPVITIIWVVMSFFMIPKPSTPFRGNIYELGNVNRTGTTPVCASERERVYEFYITYQAKCSHGKVFHFFCILFRLCCSSKKFNPVKQNHVYLLCICVALEEKSVLFLQFTLAYYTRSLHRLSFALWKISTTKESESVNNRWKHNSGPSGECGSNREKKHSTQHTPTLVHPWPKRNVERSLSMCCAILPRNEQNTDFLNLVTSNCLISYSISLFPPICLMLQAPQTRPVLSSSLCG